MRAYQIKVNGNNYSLPFADNKDVLVVLARIDNATVEEVDIKAGEAYRDGNTVLVGNIIRGVYYTNHPEHI